MKISRPGKSKVPKQNILHSSRQSIVPHINLVANNSFHKKHFSDILSGKEKLFFLNLSVKEQWIYCYQILEACTPLVKDCGVYCSAKCCSGGPNDGMLLFPGEESIYENMDVFNTEGFTIKSSHIILQSTQQEVKFLLCQGTCNRTLRPMSCRIFPLLPWIDENSIVRIKPDLRAIRMCPLLTNDQLPEIQQRFAMKVKHAFLYASLIPGTKEFLDLLHEETKTIEKFMGL